LVRVQVVASIGEQHIDLRGECPGTPQEPGGHVHGEWPQVGALRDDAS
jgi:hypothetical protein